MRLIEPARPRAVREYPNAGWLAVATVCFGAFMGQLDASIVTLTFPSLQREFDTPLAGVQWVSLSYLLTLVGLVVAVGRLSDAAGRKLVYLYGFGVFTVASLACALAPGLGWLVGFRVIQAIGAAMLQANSVALVVTSVPKERMRTALGVQASAQALGLALGPMIGGILVGSVGWRWVFWVNVPVGCLALIAGRYLLPRTRERTHLRRFDWPGLILLGLATTALLLALSVFSGLPMPVWVAVTLIAIAAAAGAGFMIREHRTKNPLVDLSVLRPAAVSGGLVGALCAYLVLFGPLTLFPQTLHAMDESEIGFLLTALPAGFAVAALAANLVLPARWGPRARALLGAGICVAAASALIVAPTSAVWLATWLAVLGLGLGVFIPANNATIMAAIPVRMSGTGGGLVNMARGLGTAIGVALVTLCLHVVGPSEATTAGSRLALAVMVLFAIIAALTGLTARPAAPESEPD
ncbi:MFS transporter [Rhodococcus qingshengii]|uniref:MFS transporter n=1 Tax=Rhodococcus qingshengii TaxID=334542 RepID=UPI0024B9B904|nr:MFS transporter [Rhodococcus qingshengii]MDJ0441447.1 MFS transporter [Rhodococcus qingshengii]